MQKTLTVLIMKYCQKVMCEMGFPKHIVELIITLYIGQPAPVKTSVGLARRFKTSCGGCQGCMLSPQLFNMHTRSVIREGP